MKTLVPDYSGLRMRLAKEKKHLTDLRQIEKMSSGTLTKINAEEFVHMKVLAKICAYLDCELEDIVKLVEEKK
ncbi:helix-turn-helix transcriptional regulator [Fictibacillus enclensis]|uniref:helix-turn-helix domain-containing protein n=1 Tax=Fictibacillus enclensis TaxID=1017270 RepID=UPI0025A04227|nr:helix-turn-helix transcriptional regulator [Fictibacillus enclensis]MDM5199228.1 helix-turn-helix transcriptional regulator [Fictibacillus enclensis]